MWNWFHTAGRWQIFFQVPSWQIFISAIYLAICWNISLWFQTFDFWKFKTMGLTQNLYCFNLPDILWNSISLILRFIKFTVIANRVHIANTAWHCMTLHDIAWHCMTLHDTACLAWHLQDTHGEHFMTLRDIYFVGLILTAAVKQISWNGNYTVIKLEICR